MEKRALLAIALSFLIMMVWWSFFAPKPPPPSSVPPAETADTAPTDDGRGSRRGDPAADSADGQTEDEAPAETIAAGSVVTETIDNDLYRVELTNEGARVVSWQLKLPDEDPLQVLPRLVGDDNPLPLAVQLDDGALTQEINEALFEVSRRRLPGGEGEELVFTWADGQGIRVEKTLGFHHGAYLVDVALEVTDRGRRLPARLTWGPGFATREVSGKGYYYYYNQALWNVSGKVSREKSVEEEIGLSSGRLLWAGIEDQYFSALLVPRGPDADALIWPVEATPAPVDGEDQEEQQMPIVAVSVPEEGALLFVGPKNYSDLSGMGHELQKAVWFSKIWLFDLMARMLYAVLIWLQANVVSNYGLAIIMTTVALRLVLFPLNQFSMVRMRRMQQDMGRLQPKINAIKKRYQKKKDAESRVKMNNELMALYKEEGVNPMGGMTGCLPLLLQFPILIGFYDMLLAAVELRGAPFFGWIQDLTMKDPYYITPILMGASMFIQQKMSAAKMGDPTQQRIMMMMPLMFTVMFINLPSGLVLYWFVNNLLGIGQQYLVNRHTARQEALAKTKGKAKGKD